MGGEAGKERRIERKCGRRKEEGHRPLLLSAACLHLMLPNVVIFFFYPSASCLDVAGEQFQDHSHTEGGENIESMPSTLATLGGDG